MIMPPSPGRQKKRLGSNATLRQGIPGPMAVSAVSFFQARRRVWKSAEFGQNNRSQGHGPFLADQWEAPPFGVDRSTTRKTSRSRAARRSRKPRTGSARLPGTAPLHCPAPLHHPVPLRRPVPSCRPALYVCSAISGRQNSFRLSKLKVPTAITSAVNPRRPSSNSNALGTHHNKKSPSEKKIVFRVPRHSQVDCK